MEKILEQERDDTHSSATIDWHGETLLFVCETTFLSEINDSSINPPGRSSLSVHPRDFIYSVL
ncbi:MAG: hypothetical protein AAFV25_22465, partial [Bacteroidota bacterium]